MKKGSKSALRTIKLLSKTDNLLGTILLGNNFANILASSLTTMVVSKYFNETWVLIVTFFLTFLVLIFAEILPKTIAVKYPEKIATSLSLPLSVLVYILSPFVMVTSYINKIIVTIFRINTKKKFKSRCFK